MARHMAYTVDVGVPTELLYRDLTTIDYWEALVEAYRENSARTEIAHFATGPGGTDVVFAHIFPPRICPPSPGRSFRAPSWSPANSISTRSRRLPDAPADIIGRRFPASRSTSMEPTC